MSDGCAKCKPGHDGSRQQGDLNFGISRLAWLAIISQRWSDTSLNRITARQSNQTEANVWITLVSHEWGVETMRSVCLDVPVGADCLMELVETK